MTITTDTRPASRAAASMTRSPAGPDSPQANLITAPIDRSPAGTNGSHGQRVPDTHHVSAVADHFPGGQSASDTQTVRAAGEAGPGQPAARVLSAPTASAPLADPLLALAADVLDDLEKVRVANENRLRQLTRGEEAVDKDGRNDRGFGLDESHPDVARLAALVGMLATAEHQAELNLARLMRGHPLGPWIAAQKGIGEKQGARLLAAIGDPYIRPEITRADSTVEPSRPRTVSELWAFCGYHVIRTPVSGQAAPGTQIRSAADGTGGHPGQEAHDTHAAPAGVAPRRVRGQQSNWSETARKRAWLVAVSCMKSTGPYRAVYDATRARYAEAVHDAPCIRCGPAGKPAPEGSALSDGHKHARALRAVAKEVLRDLWRESRRLHQPAP